MQPPIPLLHDEYRVCSIVFELSAHGDVCSETREGDSTLLHLFLFLCEILIKV